MLHRTVRRNKLGSSRIKLNQSTQGELLHEKIERMLTNGEPMEDASVAIQYSERKDGVLSQFDIRTDKWDLAQEAMNKVSSSYEAKREDRIKERETKKLEDSQEIGD